MTIKTKTLFNGKTVIKIETNSGVTGYVDSAVPPRAAKAFLVKLERAIRKNRAEGQKLERARRRKRKARKA